MFDNLRDLSDDSALYHEPPDDEAAEPSGPKIGTGRILGMTPGQRFIVVVLLFLAVLVVGSMCLLVTGRVMLG
jgi:hypothetical protein